MYAFKIVVTVFLAILIVLSGYVAAKDKESERYVGFALGIVMTMAIAAIWL